MTMRHPQGPQGAAEQAWAEQFERDQVMLDGYRTQQATRPQTLSYAMMDSPVGVAAWLLEKFHDWSDIDGDDIESVHSKDSLLTNIMVYLVTGTFNTASWIYYGRREEGGRILSPEGKTCRSADRGGAVPGGNAGLAPALLCRTRLQHRSLERNAGWRTLRRTGATGAADRGSA